MKQLSNADIAAVSGGITVQVALMATGPILGSLMSIGLRHPVSTYSVVVPFLGGVMGVAGGYFIEGREGAGFLWGINAAMISVLIL